MFCAGLESPVQGQATEIELEVWYGVVNLEPMPMFLHKNT